MEDSVSAFGFAYSGGSDRKGKSMLVFQNHTMDDTCVHAFREYPLECCGVLLGLREAGSRRVYRTVPAQNRAGASQRNTHFRIDPLELVRIENLALEKGWEIVGFYHSHPDREALPSDEDAAHMIAGYSYLILSMGADGCESAGSFEKTVQDGCAIRSERIKTEEG